jgi:flagellar L-ring protein precursor FlgH
MKPRAASLTLALVCPVLLTGCDTWDHFQKPPNFSAPGTLAQIPRTESDSPQINAANIAPLPAAMRGALWRPGSKTFFRDPRARGIGDLLTVAVNLNENAQFANQTSLTRTTANNMTISNMFGLGTLINRIIPGVVGATPAINTSGSDVTAGQGNIQRSEVLVVNVAATVVRVLPNNNLEIAGSQEISVDNELRQLLIRGIVRPEDILSDNTIPSGKIAEARIAYGGRGVSSDLQRPTWGQDVLTRAAPF